VKRHGKPALGKVGKPVVIAYAIVILTTVSSPLPLSSSLCLCLSVCLSVSIYLSLLNNTHKHTAINSFRVLIFQKIKREMTRSVLLLIERDRKGENVDTDLLRDVIQVCFQSTITWVCHERLTLCVRFFEFVFSFECMHALNESIFCFAVIIWLFVFITCVLFVVFVITDRFMWKWASAQRKCTLKNLRLHFWRRREIIIREHVEYGLNYWAVHPTSLRLSLIINIIILPH